jgi:hypothetical protein
MSRHHSRHPLTSLFAVVLGGALALAPAAVAAASPARGFGAEIAAARVAAGHLGEALWSLFAGLWAKEGPDMDPDGVAGKEGSSMDPNGSPGHAAIPAAGPGAEAGSSMDPDGIAAKAGPDMDPNG